MAAILSAEEAREIILNGEDDDEICESESDDENLCEKLLHLLDNFDGGPKFNHSFFCDNAIRLLIPVAELSQRKIAFSCNLTVYKNVHYVQF